MLIDEVIVHLTAGKGGDGQVAFSKTVMTLGPTGGMGGRGGNVVLEGVSNIGALSQFRHQKDFYAENGQNGGTKNDQGRNGKDLVLFVPVGTVVYNDERGSTQEIVKIGQRFIVARGGRGGRGNFAFRGPRNTTPKQCELGENGETVILRMVLKMIADVGFVGYPNVGKSSLLNSLTNANSKVANYFFTTLEPNLGVYSDLILADIPGLIEGASEGRGLGHRFLRHIERTETLFHLISAEDEDVVASYNIIRAELEAHNPVLLQKTQYVFLSKCDLVNEETQKRQINALATIGVEATPLSLITGIGMDVVRKILNGIEKKKHDLLVDSDE